MMGRAAGVSQPLQVKDIHSNVHRYIHAMHICTHVYTYHIYLCTHMNVLMLIYSSGTHPLTHSHWSKQQGHIPLPTHQW